MARQVSRPAMVAPPPARPGSTMPPSVRPLAATRGVLRLRDTGDPDQMRRVIAAAAQAGASAAVRAHQERQRREAYLEAVRQYDDELPEAVRAATWVDQYAPGVRSATDDAWVRAQIAKRSAYLLRLAEMFALPPEDAERILSSRSLSPLAL